MNLARPASGFPGASRAADEKDLRFEILNLRFQMSRLNSFSSLIPHPSSIPTAWLYGDGALAAERAIRRVVGWNIQGEQGGAWCAYIDGPAAAIYDGPRADDIPARMRDRLNCFARRAACRHHIFHDQHALAR